jgi:hypothetical protein
VVDGVAKILREIRRSGCAKVLIYALIFLPWAFVRHWVAEGFEKDRMRAGRLSTPEISPPIEDEKVWVSSRQHKYRLRDFIIDARLHPNYIQWSLALLLLITLLNLYYLKPALR